MSLKALIKNQTIKIDDHKWGSREIKTWDDPAIDVHIDKSTNFPYNGEQQNIRIRVPINSARDIKIENKNKNKINDIPAPLKKEIKKALGDKRIRESFLKDVIRSVDNFKSELSDIEKAQNALNRIAKHLDLEWTNQAISDYAKDALNRYAQFYNDAQGDEYFLELSREGFKAGQNNGFGEYDKRGIKTI